MQLPFKWSVPLVAGIAGIGALALAAVWWVFSGGDEVLFDQLGPSQLNGIAAELDRAGITYHVDREKNSVVVAQQDVRAARLAVMSSGNALRDAVGFELFDKSDFGMTDFAQKINYQRAMEGEIARTIGALDEIKYARVHLVLPEHNLFRSEKQRPRAGITVFLNAGAQLGADQVRSVQRIAASAVPELLEQDVTVVNQNGMTLSADASAVEDAASPARLAQKKAVENYLAEKVRGVLVQAVGIDHFAVSVDVAVDHSRKTTTREKVLDAGSDAGIKRIKASSSRKNSEVGGEENTKEVDYALGHESEQIVRDGGEIQRVQVGVVIDNEVQGVDLTKLRDLVAAAAGLDPVRGDRVAVVQNNVAVQKALQQWLEPEVKPVPVEAAGERSPRLFVVFLGGLLIGGLAVAVMRFVRGRSVSDSEVNRLRLELRQWVASDTAGMERP